MNLTPVSRCPVCGRFPNADAYMPDTGTAFYVMARLQYRCCGIESTLHEAAGDGVPIALGEAAVADWNGRVERMREFA